MTKIINIHTKCKSSLELLIYLVSVAWNLIAALLLISGNLSPFPLPLYTTEFQPSFPSVISHSFGLPFKPNISALLPSLHQHVKLDDRGEVQRVGVLKGGFWWCMFERDFCNFNELKLHAWDSPLSRGHPQGELFSSQPNKNGIVLCTAIL